MSKFKSNGVTPPSPYEGPEWDIYLSLCRAQVLTFELGYVLMLFSL